MAPSTISFHPSTLTSAGSNSPRSGFPDRAILCNAVRTSKHRNATTAQCETSEGHTVEVSFWLVDPPAVSYLSVNCPGLDESHFADKMDPPWLVCAEATFVLFTVTVRGTTDHFVYTAGPAGDRSLQLLPDPNTGPFTNHPYALLPRGGDSFDVAFLDRRWISQDDGWRFHASVFSSETQSWRRSRVSLQHLSDSDKSLCGHHGLSKQIAVGGDSLGWVDLASGILLLQDLFDEHPVIRFIHFPESRVCFMDDDGIPHYPDEYYCNVACYDDLIKFIHIEFDDPAIRTSGQAWRATMWSRKISWNNWRRCSTVDVANISVDQSYSDLLPVLRNDEMQRLELERLIFHTPVPSVRNDDVFYMMAKVNGKKDTAWAIAIDMKRAAVEAMAPFSAQVYSLVTMYRPCVFPKYLNMTPGAGMGNPVNECFKRLSAKQCLVEVLWTLDWLRELDQVLEIERSTYNTCRLLLQLSPVSSLRSNIELMVKCASFCNGQGEAASKAANFCLRALDGFDLALHESPCDLSASVEAMRFKIRDVLQALDNILQIVPPALIPEEGTPGEGKRGEALSETCEKPDNESDKWQKETSEPSNSRVEKYQENKGACDRKERRAMMVWDVRLLILIVLFLASLVFTGMPSPPLIVRKAVS
ncbi:uncharacterized protein [Lolium perenne]|uniref:uncharacterized protein isoform X1 n=1 Tax=Lolium perenne TaxID=4522 RepID=UPI0021F57DB4|nr:uncharacterized protein LOC127336818 isoform X1 [Lolium perenne]